MFCISLSYKKASLEIREQLSLSPAVLAEMGHGVFLETCNRIELYGTGALYKTVEQYFRPVKRYLLLYENEQAIRHLFRVTGGLDSMVLGEDEILGQVKKAYAYSLENGYTDYELNTVFQAAITCAKKIKTETLLSKSSVSVATLAASLCRKYSGEKKTVLVIGGSGDTGSKVIKDLASLGEFEIYATVREHSVKSQVHLIHYRDRYAYFGRADIVISATKSPHFTVTADMLDGKERLYIDLAAPRDIDTAIGNVVTLDSLKELAKHNNALKQNAVGAAESIMNEELEALFKELALHRLMPLNAGEELKHFIYAFRDKASAAEFTAFTDVVQRMEEEQ